MNVHSKRWKIEQADDDRPTLCIVAIIIGCFMITTGIVLKVVGLLGHGLWGNIGLVVLLIIGMATVITAGLQLVMINLNRSTDVYDLS